MAHQKQRKQLILTDSKNISTYCFQPIQRIPTILIIPQRQRIQSNFMNDRIRTFMHTKQLNTHTQLEQLKQQYQQQHKFCSIHIQTPQGNWYISSIPA